jgi:hypothetical protein
LGFRYQVLIAAFEVTTSGVNKAEVTQRRIGELQRGVFKILFDHPEGLFAKEVLQHMEQVVPPTQFEKSDYETRPGATIQEDDSIRDHCSCQSGLDDKGQGQVVSHRRG